MVKLAAPTQKGDHHKRNTKHKKRRAARDLPKTNKKTAKNKLRDAERWLARLQKQGADAAQLATQQSVVDELNGVKVVDETARKQVDKEKRYAERYRKVKFFEKQKIRRRLKKLRKELASESTPADGAARLLVLEGDLAYVTFYPKDRKYVGLFTVRGTDDAKTVKRRAEARRLALEAAAVAGDAGASSSDKASDDEMASADEAASDGEESRGDFFLAA